MILAPDTHALLVRLVTARLERLEPVVPSSLETAETLQRFGLAEISSTLPHTVRITDAGLTVATSDALVRCGDHARLTGARTAFGRVAGMVLPNHGRTVRIAFLRDGNLLDIELPTDCLIEVQS